MEKQPTNGVVVSGSSQPAFAQTVAHHIGLPLGNVTIERFPDNETHVVIHDDVQGKLVFIVQSLVYQPNEYLVELLLLLDAARRSGARKCVVVMPYFGYARQDRQDRSGVPIAARLIADLLEKAGCDRLLTVDIHAEQIEGFFSIAVENISAIPLLAEEIAHWAINSEWVVVAPDIGSIKIARALATQIHTDFVVVDKHRHSPTHVEQGTLIGDIKNRNVLLADDMCSTGGTLLSAAKACREKGAQRVCAVVTHGLFADGAMAHLEASPIETLWVTDTIPWKGQFPTEKLCHTVSIVPLLALAISRHFFAEGFSTVR